MKIAVVIPAYKVAKHIGQVLATLPDFVDYIIVVDDKCPENSGKIAGQIQDKRLTLIYHETNQGVGGAVISGYRKAVELGADVIVKIDGDSQMDPRFIKTITDMISDQKADYVKGNRFHDLHALRTMPFIRLIGNVFFSFLFKIASGYWDITDPTNGYTGISTRILSKINLDKISKRYFFETDMLMNLGIIGAVVKDIDMPAKYGDEKSSICALNILLQFPAKLFIRFIKRIFFKYFIQY